MINKAWPPVFMLSFFVAIMAIAFHFRGGHTAVFKCGEARSPVTMFMTFDASGMKIECPVHTHLTGEKVNSSDDWLVVCECDK
jgi:hypothetical protein